MLGKVAVRKLAALRVGLEEADPEAWPAGAETEIALLGDVVRVLGGGPAEVEQVLGPVAAEFIGAVEQERPFIVADWRVVGVEVEAAAAGAAGC